MTRIGLWFLTVTERRKVGKNWAFKTDLLEKPKDAPLGPRVFENNIPEKAARETTAGTGGQYVGKVAENNVQTLPLRLVWFVNRRFFAIIRMVA